MARRPFRDGARAATAVLSAAALVVLVAGCSGESITPPSPSHTTSRPLPSLSPSPTPAAPVLVPDGSAQDNLPLFTAVVEKVWASPDRVAGRAYIDALVAAGFDKAQMQVTNDKTTVGNAVESIQFSVHWRDGQCLVGQVGPTTGNPVAVVLPGLPGGLCLLGKTRPIDW